VESAVTKQLPESPCTQLSAIGEEPQLLVAQEGVIMYAPPPPVVCTQICPGPQMTASLLEIPPPLHDTESQVTVWTFQDPSWQTA
jgi:hypothetical protein